MLTEKFGVTEKGEETKIFTLKNKNGMEARVSDMGAVLVSLIVPDRAGNPVDVVLGYDTSEDYEHNRACLGATIGRSGNRIDGPSFELNGKTYVLPSTGPGVNLHSGPDTYFTRKWNYTTEEGPDAESVTFFMMSPDGDQGYPGNMDIEVTYTLTDENELLIDYYGCSDQDTIMNMTNHSYFNLNGQGNGDVLNHKVKLYADYFTATDARLVPTGELVDVTGTPMDFREEKTIGRDIHADYEPLRFGRGYDHNFAVNDGKVQEDAELIAVCTGDLSGIRMEVYTDLPGVQMYTANTTHDHGKGGAQYGIHSGVCFETQFFPDAVHHPAFASPVIRKGEENRSLTVYRFMTE